jgi:hypothetical protein
MTLSSRESGLTFSVYVGSLEEPHRAAAESLAAVVRALDGKRVAKTIFVPDRLLNLVAR